MSLFCMIISASAGSFFWLQTRDWPLTSLLWLPAVCAELGWFCSFGVSGYPPPWILTSTLEHKETCLGTAGPARRNPQNHPNSTWRAPISQMLKWEKGAGVAVIRLFPVGSLFKVNLKLHLCRCLGADFWISQGKRCPSLCNDNNRFSPL